MTRRDFLKISALTLGVLSAPNKEGIESDSTVGALWENPQDHSLALSLRRSSSNFNEELNIFSMPLEVDKIRSNYTTMALARADNLYVPRKGVVEMNSLALGFNAYAVERQKLSSDGVGIVTQVDTVLLNPIQGKRIWSSEGKLEKQLFVHLPQADEGQVYVIGRRSKQDGFDLKGLDILMTGHGTNMSGIAVFDL